MCHFSATLPALLPYDILLAFTNFLVKIKIFMKLKMQEYLEEIKFYSHPRNVMVTDYINLLFFKKKKKIYIENKMHNDVI